MDETDSSSEGDQFETLLAVEGDEINGLDLPKDDDDLSPLDVQDIDQGGAEDRSAMKGEESIEEEEGSKVLLKTSFDIKLRELLRNLCSIEVKMYSEASKEFISLLRGDGGGKILHQYVQASPSCIELMEAWKLRQAKPGMSYVLSLISTILDNPYGKYCMDDIGRLTISRRLDKLARSIIETKLEDIYTELNSGEPKRQNAALSLMASIVRRGVGLASEVAKIFNFKLTVFPKLAGLRLKKEVKKTKSSTRRSFVEFAMSFLEVGNPRLLRWILQQKDMYFGILRGLGSDDDKTIVYVLSTLRDKVLNPDSLVPPGLQSVLFGSVTLEQLSEISGNPTRGSAAEMAHEILVMVCTDPCHGLMPDLKTPGNPLRGNLNRLLGLMKKLRATESGYHRDLLLAVVKGKPSLCSAYLDEFPYILEPRASPMWFSAISLAADLISSSNTCLSFASQSDYPPPLESYKMQCMLKCMVPRSFTRSVINRGLLHSDILVKHGSLRILLEALKLLDSLVNAINDVVENMTAQGSTTTVDDCLAKLKGLPGIVDLGNVGKCSDTNEVGIMTTGFPTLQKWVLLKQQILDEVRAILPDSQVLLKLLSSLSHNYYKKPETSLKRTRASESSHGIHCTDGVKKLKSSSADENIDILVSGIAAEPSTDAHGDHGKGKPTYVAEELGTENDDMMVIAGIWDLSEFSLIGDELKDAEMYFHSKLLDVLKLYLRTMPIGLEGSFDFFKLLQRDRLILPVSLQQSLLSLLIEYIGQSPGSRVAIKCPELMYKHLQLLIDLLIFSPVKAIQDQAYVLARAAMLSTGAFDRNLSEIDAWLLFLPGYCRDECFVESHGRQVFRALSEVVISFFCDAISTVGNNLYKYLDLVHHFTCKIEDISPDFSPLVICILQKCLTVLESDSGTLKLSERSMISIYVSNTLSFLLQTQENVRLLGGLIELILTDKPEHSYFRNDDSGESLCEWRPLWNLLLSVRSVLHQNACFSFYSVAGRTMSTDGSSLLEMLDEVNKNVRSVHDHGLVEFGIAFYSAIASASPDDVLENFPLLITVARPLFGEYLAFLLYIFFHERNFLVSVANLWPDMFSSGVEIISATTSTDSGIDDVKVLNCDVANSSITTTVTSNGDLDVAEAAAVSFSLILKRAPFYVLFPAIAGFRSSSLLCSTKILDLLRTKLSACSIDCAVESLRHVLFWVHQIGISLRSNPSGELEEMLDTCFILIDHVLERLFVMPADFDTSETIGGSLVTISILRLAEIFFHHPAVTNHLLHPLCYTEKLRVMEASTGAPSLEDLLSSSRQSLHAMEHHILHVLKQFDDYLLALGNAQGFASSGYDAIFTPVMKSFKQLAHQAVSVLKDKFDLCIVTKDLIPLLPGFYIFHSLMRFMSPFELVDLVHWMFCKVKQNDEAGPTSFSALPVGLYTASEAFDILSNCLRQRNMETVISPLFYEIGNGEFDVTLLEKVYHMVIEFASNFRFESADLCLLKAVNVVHGTEYESSQTALLPLRMVMSRIIISSPMRMLTHLINKPSKTKAKTLSRLTDVSPVHLNLFGQILLSSISKALPSGDSMTAESILLPKWEISEESGNFTISDEEFLLLLPAAVSYLTSNIESRKKHLKLFRTIPLFYSRILLDGFLNWKSYIPSNIFEEEYDDFMPMSMKEFLRLFNGSLLGKSIHMLQFYFMLNGNTMKRKKRLKIFDSIYPSSDGHYDELLDCDIGDVGLCSLKQSLNFINRVVAKIYFTRMLLFPLDSPIELLPMEADESTKEPLKKVSSRMNSVRLRFMNILVAALDKIVKKFPHPDNAKKPAGTNCFQLFRFLELFILRNIVHSSVEMRSDLIQLHNIPFLERFACSALLHRFEDPTTLRALRSTLVSLAEVKFSFAEVFEMVLAHSQFIPTILCNDSMPDKSRLSQTGTLVRPISGILKLPIIPSNNQNAEDGRITCETELKCKQDALLYKRKLEIIKLLRVLYHLKGRKDASMNSREFLSLLLSGYGATLSETDLEIFDLMHEIESVEGSEGVSISDMDYMWGSSALKLRRDQKLERFLSSHDVTDCETAEERRKRQFRENFPVDSKLCAMTVLHFCYDRISWNGVTSLAKLQENDFMDVPEVSSANSEIIQRYDPAFILRFSIHGLSMGYMEPIEFAGMGLLAVAFVSMSSSDEGIRKLGYEVLGRFKMALENCCSNRAGLRLRLLLTYLQNGITEPWQRLPSVTAIFSAEASFILLDPSHDHYLTISKFLTCSPRVDLKCLPLFHTLFGSSSIHFKTDRMWILRLSYAGLNVDDDVQIFMRKFLLELLLSFYSSSLSDCESKTLILQILKKSVKFHMLARYLVEHCGLVSWLSSILSLHHVELSGDHKDFYMRQVTMALEVANDVLSLRTITEWLQKYALEQLSELSCHLHMLFVGGMISMKENTALANSILHVLASALRISQKRKIYQPHFTLSVDGLFRLYKAIDGETIKIDLTAELGLKTILMSTPPTVMFHTERGELLKFLMWAVSTALESDSRQAFALKRCDLLLINFPEEKLSEDSLVAKLIRWLTASVILGRISSIPNKIRASFPPESSSTESLQSLLDRVKQSHSKSSQNADGINEALSIIILYLQQHLGVNSRLFPSVVSALCLLLPYATSSKGSLASCCTGISSLCSKIRCPPEVSPAWRWSYHLPWEDRSLELTDLQKMDECHACQALLITFSNALGENLSGLPALSCCDLEKSGLFTWERNIIPGEES